MNSIKSVNCPCSLRTFKIASTAFEPTFLTAFKPKRMTSIRASRRSQAENGDFKSKIAILTLEFSVFNFPLEDSVV